MSVEKYDIAIIGAGVVGAALACFAIKKYPNCSVVVFEKNNAPGLETSSRNSGVLHSGFHQKQGSLKAHFAKLGSVMAQKFALKHNVPLLRCGMLIAVPFSSLWNPKLALEEGASFFNLLKRARNHDITYKFLTGFGIKKLEPHIHATFGIFLPEVCVIDSGYFTETLEEVARKDGAHFFFENTVSDIRICKNHTLIVTDKMEVCAKVVINAAGLHADDIANLALRKEKYQQYPWRGEYYEVINPEKRKLINGLVYPVVPASYPGKGMHFGPRPDGRLFLGPNAVRVATKTSYNENHTPKKPFLDIAKKFLPCLEEEDITWSHSGIRPKISDTPKEDDFIIAVDSHDPVFVNLIGIESPGISSAMALARHVLDFSEIRRALR